MTPEEDEKYAAMREYCETFDDMPDGAFFAMAEDSYGWSIDDWAWYEEMREEPL